MPQKNKTINLALQGGGAHGAFAWGVLDRLLEDGRLDVDGICGTSAGAMNGVVYAYGKMTGGKDGAREALASFWEDVSEAGQVFSPIQGNPFEQLFGTTMQQSASFAAFDAWTRVWSPYQFNPYNFNPLRDVLERHVDFDQIHRCTCTNIFVSTTNVRTGKPKIFGNETLSADTVLASACLPFLFQAVRVGEEYYWDGGYTGNPAIYPLIYHTETEDVLVVHINPLVRDELPTTAPDIMNRVNEVTFNASLIAEMRAINFVQKLLHSGWLKEEYKDNLKDIHIHAIRADEDMESMNLATKFSPDWAFLTHLRDLGRARAGEWLKRNFDTVGKKSSIDIREAYL